MSDVKQRARNAMIGLAIGDALSWTSMFHRSVLQPPWTRRVRREMDAASETTNVIVTPMPFSLNQPAEHLNLSPSMCAEWSSFTADVLLNGDINRFDNSLLSAWQELAFSKEPIRGYISSQAALQNLRNGILPPQSGKQNPHYFDDGAMARAVPIGIMCSGKPEEAARLALIDASVTNSEDGVWAAQAIAVAISGMTAGMNKTNAIDNARHYLPKSSWIDRTVNDAFKITQGASSLISVLPELQHRIVNREYSYGNVAPETLALAFAIVSLHGDNVESAVLSAAGFPKSAESLPAVVGALSGAMQSEPMMNDAWKNVLSTLKGICIPSFAGKEYLSIIEQLALRAEKP